MEKTVAFAQQKNFQPPPSVEIFLETRLFYTIVLREEFSTSRRATETPEERKAEDDRKRDFLPISSLKRFTTPRVLLCYYRGSTISGVHTPDRRSHNSRSASYEIDVFFILFSLFSDLFSSLVAPYPSEQLSLSLFPFQPPSSTLSMVLSLDAFLSLLPRQSIERLV